MFLCDIVLVLREGPAGLPIPDDFACFNFSTPGVVEETLELQGAWSCCTKRSSSTEFSSCGWELTNRGSYGGMVAVLLYPSQVLPRACRAHPRYVLRANRPPDHLQQGDFERPRAAQGKFCLNCFGWIAVSIAVLESLPNWFSLKPWCYL